MTEHSKIPLPGKSDGGNTKRGGSLFERAEDALGEGGFAPAPVPEKLAKPVNRKVKKTPRQQAEPVVPPKAEAPVPVAPVSEATSAAVAPKPRIALPSKQHHVDRDALALHGFINPDGAVTELLEEFRIIKRQLLKAARADDTGFARRILVCSPLPDEGKTFCAANLALAMAAERDCEVVLVDADVAKPSILSLLGLPKGKGLMDALANPEIAVEDCVIATDISGLYVLPAGHQTHADSEYLASARTAEVLDRLTQGAPERVLVFDSPPALAASPAADLANHVGQAVVVARADKTGQSALEDALSLLSNCPDIKLLLNDAHFSPSGRRFGAYYGQGG